MYRRFHDRFGPAGIFIGVVALVVALGGTAFANGLFSKAQEKKIAQIAKKYAGKPGAPGAQGPAGANGKDGANGSTGAQGPPGANGTNGTNGAAGKSVVTGNESAGANCAEGGIWVEVEGSGTKKYVCNGEGVSGSSEPQTVLQSGETEAGVWQAQANFSEPALLTISFPLRVPGDYTKAWMPSGQTPTTECPGTQLEPKAAPGFLCIYAEEVVGMLFTQPTRKSPFLKEVGFQGEFASNEDARGYAYGSWAVTAP